MKKIITGFFLLFVVTIGFSQKTLKEEYGIVIKDYTSFSNFVCACYYGSVNYDVPSDYLDDNIMVRLGLKKNHPDKRKIVGKVLNEYHNYIICGEDNSHRHRDNEPLIKRAIGRGEFGLIDHLMIFEDDYGYNLNNYEIVDGKKETILDYIEKILNNPKILEGFDEDLFRVLHNDFIEYEAKRGSELD